MKVSFGGKKDRLHGFYGHTIKTKQLGAAVDDTLADKPNGWPINDKRHREREV